MTISQAAFSRSKCQNNLLLEDWKLSIWTKIDVFLLFLPLHTGSCCPIYGRAPAPPQGYRRCVGAYPTPVYHRWRAHSEDRETLGIEPGTSRSPDERSTN